MTQLKISGLVFLIAFMPGSLTAEEETAATWKAGVAQVAITPQQPMWMAGYGNRTHPATEKLHDLRAKALVIEDADANRAVLISVEVTGIDRRFSVNLCDALATQYQLQREQLAICCTHTHSGPVTSDRFPFVFGLDQKQDALRRQYLAGLHEKLVKLVGDSLQSLAPARLAWGTGSATFAGNRRNNPPADAARLREAGALRGPFDHDVPVLSVCDGQGQLKAVVFGYACHATTFGPSNYHWSGDFFIASYVTEAMESTWVSAATPHGEEFRKLDCRQTQPWGSVFTVARDAEAKAYLRDGRWNLPAAEASEDLWQDFYYRRPILVALDEETGLAVIIMVDPNVCSLLGGQHHIVETAHDFAFNADLKPEQPFVGRARLVIRNIGTFPEATGKIDELWRDFQKFLGE